MSEINHQLAKALSQLESDVSEHLNELYQRLNALAEQLAKSQQAGSSTGISIESRLKILSGRQDYAQNNLCANCTKARLTSNKRGITAYCTELHLEKSAVDACEMFSGFSRP